jgi:betaine-aldehyde dehydrogenase
VNDVEISRNIPKVLTSWINGQSVPIKRINKDDQDRHYYFYTNLSPGTGKSLGDIQIPTHHEIDDAVESSRRAFANGNSDHCADWSSPERGKILQIMATSLQDHAEYLTILEALDTGLPITQIRSSHVPIAIQTLEYYAAMALSNSALCGRIVDVPHAGGHKDSIAYTRREPLGVCVGIGGWNYPLVTFCWKLPPALCMGNTMIYKPSEFTPLTSLHLVNTIWKDLLPPGVLQVLTGGGTTAQRLWQITSVDF